MGLTDWVKKNEWVKNNIVDLEGGDTANDVDKKVLKSTIESKNPPTLASIPSIGITPVSNLQQGSVIQVDEKFLKHFDELMKSENLPGPDYLEFMDVLNKLASNPAVKLQEDQLFSMAWISFSAMGGIGDTTTLIKAAEHYLNILEKDKAVFNEKLQNKVNETAGTFKGNVEALDLRNKTILDEIAKLQQEMSANNVQISDLNTKIAEQTQKNTNNLNSYNYTFTQVSEQIKSDVNKIKTYIK